MKPWTATPIHHYVVINLRTLLMSTISSIFCLPSCVTSWAVLLLLN